MVLFVSVRVRRVLGYPVGGLCCRGSPGQLLQVAVVCGIQSYVFEPFSAVGGFVLGMRVRASLAVRVTLGLLFDDVQCVLGVHASEGRPQHQPLCAEAGVERPVEKHVREALGEVNVDGGVSDYPGDAGPDCCGWLCGGDGARQGAQFANGGLRVVLHVEAVGSRVTRTEAQPTVGVCCWMANASVRWMMSVLPGTGRWAIAVGRSMYTGFPRAVLVVVCVGCSSSTA